eukprot:5113974-Amphidinium_carterae.2
MHFLFDYAMSCPNGKKSSRMRFAEKSPQSIFPGDKRPFLITSVGGTVITPACSHAVPTLLGNKPCAKAKPAHAFQR